MNNAILTTIYNQETFSGHRSLRYMFQRFKNYISILDMRNTVGLLKPYYTIIQESSCFKSNDNMISFNNHGFKV